jgi:menaquinone-9 beta-reductase
LGRITEDTSGAPTVSRQRDVTVIGGGLAGMAAAIELARAGLRVTCLEPTRDFDHLVGESLDWSAPDLFANLGLPMDDLVRAGTSTYKRHVILKLSDGSFAEYIPSPWLGRRPFNVELRTLHIDRGRLHGSLLQLAATFGVELIQDRAVEIEREGESITAVLTEQGQRLISTWFLDASGAAASLFARKLNLPSVQYGPRKVAIWTYFQVSEWVEGTTLYAEALEKNYMDWIWEIPIHPGTISVGYVAPGPFIKDQRSQGLSTQEIFTRRLAKFPRFQPLLQKANYETLRTTSFVCHCYRKACGGNWFILGEAVSQPDPITGNGVTGALRHATEASRLILRFKEKRRLSSWSSAAYNLRVLAMGRFFNSLIEKLAYDWPIRDRLGTLIAGDAYTIPAWSVNLLYSRIRPDGMIGTVLFNAFLVSLRAVVRAFYWLCRRFPPPTAVPVDSAT